MWGLILLSTKAQGFLSRLHTLQPLCISPAGIIVVGMQINSSIMQSVSSAWSRHLSFFSLPPLNICSDGLLFRLKWESRCQRCHLLKNHETDWRMRPGWYSNLKARELINLSAGVANVGIKAQTQIVMEQMKVKVVSAENVPRGRN